MSLDAHCSLAMTRLVEDSINMGQPIIAVSVNYRLNVFAFGNAKGEKNLALQDQSLAIQWVREHIAGFGGDPVSACRKTLHCSCSEDLCSRMKLRSPEKVLEPFMLMRTSH